jgi:hypothetical protein
MSRIAPDIPELQHVPDAARSLARVRQSIPRRDPIANNVG